MKKEQLEKVNKIASKLAEGYIVDNDYSAPAFLTFFKKGSSIFMSAWFIDYEAIQYDNAPEDTTSTMETVELNKYDVLDLLENAEAEITSKLNLYFSKK